MGAGRERNSHHTSLVSPRVQGGRRAVTTPLKSVHGCREGEEHIAPLKSVRGCREEEHITPCYTSFTWFSVLGLLRMERLLCLRNGFFSRQNSLRTELERRSKICLHLSSISCPILVSHSNIKSLNLFSPWQVI